MSRSLTALWVALLAAISVIVTLAYLWNVQREQIAQQRVEEILQLQLQPFRRSITEVLDGYSLSLQRELSGFGPADLQACVELARLPLADEVVVTDRAQQLHFPRDSRLSTDRQSLVAEALQLLREQADPRPALQSMGLSNRLPDATEDSAASQTAIRAKTYAVQSRGEASQQQPVEAEQFQQTQSVVASPGSESFGWVTWYHRRGIVLGFWWAQSEDWRTMIVLPRARWMADLVGKLPESASPNDSAFSKLPSTVLPGGLTQLIDVEGKVIYQWGDAPSGSWEQLQSRPPSASLPLDEPLEGWRLQMFASDELRQRLSGESILIPLILAVAGLALALLLVGVFVTVNLNRQLRLAANRVSFVNQVSHELRTPLTNIRMYADLLAQQFEDHAEQVDVAERVAVIQGESQRLSRLISNVLQFARPAARGQPRRTSVVLDELVEQVLATFRPRLQRAGFRIELNLHTPQPRQLDADAVEQILVNLIGNAEKYGASGKLLQLSTQTTGESVIIDVQDHGPGIAAHQRERIFEPFVRLSDGLEDPAGTGIGLTIVRQLAQEHGGTCELLPSERGAHFRCILSTPW